MAVRSIVALGCLQFPVVPTEALCARLLQMSSSHLSELLTFSATVNRDVCVRAALLVLLN